MIRYLSRTVIAVVLVAVIAAVLVLLAAAFIAAFLGIASLFHLQHALGMDTQTSKQYASSSGVLPMIVAALGFSGVLVTAYKHLNCEEPGCPRLGHRHPGHGRPVCRTHYHHDVTPERKS